MRLSGSKYFALAAGLLAIPVTIRMERPVPAKPLQQTHQLDRPTDPRAVRLHQFLSKLKCPVRDMAEDFVRAADDNNLDWRLLPSISIIESGGGKAYKNNNIMGWGNGDRIFPTIRAGIHQVAFKLGKSSLYRHRDTDGKLRIYNPDEEYAPKVEAVMQRISPVPTLKLIAYERYDRANQPLFLSRN